MTNLIEKALSLALPKYQGETWKKTKRPMVYHPLAVASLVLKYGGNEAQAAAAILHDTGCIPLDFGSEVTQILKGFEDPPIPKEAEKDWAFGKKAYIDKVSELPDFVLLVILCEELHELSELVLDLQTEGEAAWKRYPVPGRDITWYFRKMTEVAYKRLMDTQTALVQEMGRLTRRLTANVHEGASL